MESDDEAFRYFVSIQSDEDLQHMLNVRVEFLNAEKTLSGSFKRAVFSKDLYSTTLERHIRVVTNAVRVIEDEMISRLLTDD